MFPDSKLLHKTRAFLLGSGLLICLPFLHIGFVHKMIWVPYKTPVNRDSCTCSCFDTVMRGSYEKPGNSSYKHLYFNATKETFKIWILTVLFVLMTYESIKYLYKLFRKGDVRMTMFVLYLANIYPNYYSWWDFLNYYNESFYLYFYNDFYFMLTEILVTVLVLNLCDTKNQIASWKILLIITINSMHIVVSCSNQFIEQVILKTGKSFQNARNIGLTIPDVLHVVLCIYILYNYAKLNRVSFKTMFTGRELILCGVYVIGTIVMYCL
ncbi:uncharacterized protein LOC126807992 [Patella vulgata]|uniref:uncharacterized protein LOC126807992 n=1 Tax=Patella vulgata TaxID=6465 RepID=UPI00218071C0|nr:uncharacterized protein LOC126807992 [Patella vulgata]XP_050388966.1 uncharacterized protein LOC126807992 [Patella vulgata]